LIVKLWNVRSKGHEKVEIEEKKENGCEEILESDFDEIKGNEPEKGASDGWSFEHHAPGLEEPAGPYRAASKWWRVERFFGDLADYETWKPGIQKEEFWPLMRKWEFQGKVIQKNGSYFVLNRFSWDEAR